MTRLERWTTTVLGAIVVGAFFSAIGAAAPVVPPASREATSAVVSADFTVTYSYDQNGNRTKETGPALPENSGADKCGNGTNGLVPMFMNGQMVSVYPGVCQ